MSTGNLRYEIKGEAELANVLGKNDTPELYARAYRVDTSHDIPYAAGNSVDGSTVYIDAVLYREVMDGEVYVRGMTPSQIIRAWREHEHAEWAVEMGDNSSQTYPASHGFATASEHKYVGDLPIDPDRYEACIRAGLERAKRRFIEKGSSCNPPRDLWCGPVLDDPDKDDRVIIGILKAKGVADAFKLSKSEVRYGMGPQECRDCGMFGDRDVLPSLRKCDLINGLVQRAYWCERWVARK